MTSSRSRRERYRSYLQTEHWRLVRAGVLAERGRECEVCGTDRRLQIHHLHYDSLGNEDGSELVVLCDDCHADAHDGLREIQAEVECHERGSDGPTPLLDCIEAVVMPLIERSDR